MSRSEDRPQIGEVPPERAPEALRLVFSHLPAEDLAQQVQTLLTHGRSGRVSLECLLEARRGGRLVGAVFSQILPGKTAVVWPPRVVPEQPASLEGELLEAACRRMTVEDVRVAHALLEIVTQADDAVLRRAGFDPLADLLYLVSLEGQFPTSRPTSPLEFETYRADNHDRLARVLKATYEQTLDCPRMHDVRSIDDILEGYRATGVFDPGRWLIVRHGGRDVGCLLLADHPEHGNWELVYMGLVAAARGHGWGADIARYGQWLTGRAGHRRMVLAVDADNAPAIAVYAAVGFQTWDRRTVYAKVLQARGPEQGPRPP